MQIQTSKEKAYGVSIEFTEIDNIENLSKGKVSSKSKEIFDIALKFDCIGLKLVKNSINYLFLLNKDRNLFYNTIKGQVKCKLVKKPFMVERNMPVESIMA